MEQVKRGEVWWVVFDASIGGEIKKTRPAVIVSNDAANEDATREVGKKLEDVAKSADPKPGP